MKKTFKQIENMLLVYGLRKETVVNGESYDLDDVVKAGNFASEMNHKIMVISADTTVNQISGTSCVTFMYEQGKVSPEVLKSLNTRFFNGGPIQVLIVKDLARAEEKIITFLSDRVDTAAESLPSKMDVTVADIEALPEDKIASTYEYNGSCPYCGKPLEKESWFGAPDYKPCTCEVGQAAYAHNERRDQKRKEMFAALKTVADIKAFRKDISIPMFSEDGNHCAFCGKPLGTKDLHTSHCSDHHRYVQEECWCDLANAAREHNKQYYRSWHGL